MKQRPSANRAQRRRVTAGLDIARYEPSTVLPAMTTPSGGTFTTDAAPDAVPELDAPMSELDFEQPPVERWQPEPRPSLMTSTGDWLRSRTPEQWAFAAIFFLAAILRLWGLGDKPLHHDESLHAYYSWQFLINPSGYQYDPLLHGPFQFHVIPFFYVLGRLFGTPDNGINDFTVRLLPALMGLAMVAMPYWLRSQLGRWGALSMAFLLAISPTFVYYSRFVRDDIYVTCCTLLIVVAAIQYSQTRRMIWLLMGVIALLVSYASMENTFFTIATFGSFLLVLVLWDLGPRVGDSFGFDTERTRATAGRLMLLVPLVIAMGLLAYVGLHWLSNLSDTINALAAKYGNDAANAHNPDVIEHRYELLAVFILLIVSIAVSLAATIGMTVRMFREPTAPLRAPRWHAWVDPRRQPVLDTLLSTDWVRWFVAFVVAWVLFAVFFVEIPANALSLAQWGSGFQDGLGRGLLRGIYYWLEQQHVARGGQPWYYYFILIPLYEPLALVFGLAGLVRALVQPTRFRLFLVYWFVVNLGLYTWAGEKMPWLVIHIMLPLIGLAGVALDWVLSVLVRGARAWWTPTRAFVAAGLIFVVGGIAALSIASTVAFAIGLGIVAIVAIGVVVGVEQWHRGQALRLGRMQLPGRRASKTHSDQYDDITYQMPALRAPGWTKSMNQGIAVGCMALAIALLVPTLWNMQRVTFFEPSVAPNEMLVYVQTTTDVQLVMNKLDALDRALYHGQHKLRIGVTGDPEWPFAWYLRMYPYQTTNNVWSGGAAFSYSTSTPGPLPDVILGGLSDGSQGITATYPGKFASHQYHLRWWWDESYKLPQCSKITPKNCLTNPPLGVGVGPLLWISYGAYPPQPCQNGIDPQCDSLNAKPNATLAANRYWNWLWQRQNISGTTPESTDFILYVRTDLTKYVSP